MTFYEEEKGHRRDHVVMGRGWRAAASLGKPPELEIARKAPCRLTASLQIWGLQSREATAPETAQAEGEKAGVPTSRLACETWYNSVSRLFPRLREPHGFLAVFSYSEAVLMPF